MENARRQKGFTLIEILLVVAAIAILAGIVIVAVNPAKQLAATRDAERQSEINTLLNGVSQFYIAESAAADALTIPTGTCTPGTATQEVCVATATGTCATGVVLAADLVPEYLAAMPSDPTTGDTDFTGYYIARSASSNRITVCGVDEASGATITVTR